MSKYSSPSSWVGRGVAAVLAFILLGFVFFNLVVDNLPKGEVRKVKGYTPWPEETLKAIDTLPVQDNGRVKPFSTYAGFTMLGIHGARSMKVEGETVKIKGKDKKIFKLTPTAWLMDSLFRPHIAADLPTFRIDNSDVLKAIGITARGKRDRYSYNDIEGGREKLVELAKSYELIESKKRDPVQQQTIDLAYHLRTYESILGYFGFARSGVVLMGSGTGGTADSKARVSDLMRAAPQIRQELAKSQASGTPIEPRIQHLLEQVLDAANFSKFSLLILPPSDSKDPLWKTAGNSIMETMTQQAVDPARAADDIRMLEDLNRALPSGEGAFRDQLISVRDNIAARAKARDEFKSVELEASFYRSNWFLNALVLFLIGTITGMAMWLSGNGTAARVLAWVTFGFTFAGMTACVTAIVQRCMIMGRPPVGNLYDTIIFIAATVVIFALIVEWMTRRRFALGIAPILGTLLIVLARRYEMGDAKDHMTPLVAVLDSNFWLTIHVITITLGYSAGLLSAFLSCGYLLVRGLDLDGGDKDLRRSLTRAVYGMVCLTLFLSLVGTVLGGIWANYSWGRFWGWDPKENGALMIVIWMLVILHARVGGYIHEWGLHLASVFTACVVAFSWWHVNFLGVGLHNYGFTAGKGAIWIFYCAMLAVLVFGFICMALEKYGKDVPGNAAPRKP